MSTPDGGLWISFNPSGLGFLKQGKFVYFDQPRFELVSFARDLEGRIWAGTRAGLFLFDGNDWLEIGESANFVGHRIWTMFVDRSGTLWVAVDNTVVFLRRGSNTFAQTGTHLAGVPRIAQASDGRLWLSQWDRPLQAIGQDGRILPTPKIVDTAVNFLFDRDGALWMVGDMHGVCRLRFPERLANRIVSAHDPELERFTEHEGLTDDTAITLLEDREGNIWVASNKGINRFRHSRLVPLKLPSTNRSSTLMAANRDEIWIASDQRSPFLRIRGDKIISTTTRARISSVYRESESTVWWGGLGGLWRQQNDRFDFFPQPERFAVDWVWEVFPDDSEGGLWVELGDFGLIHFKNGLWTFPRKPEGLPDLLPSAAFRETEGRTWLGYDDSRVVLLTPGQVRVYSREDGIDIGRIRVIRGHGSQIFVGGELGLAVLENGRFATVRMSENRAFGAITGMVETPDGALWLNERSGIVYISPIDISQLANEPNHAVMPEIFTFLDGLRGAPQVEFRCSTAIQATGGRLWFATDNGLVWIDPIHIVRNTVPPPVYVDNITADGKAYAASNGLKLPPLVRNLAINYTAMSLAMPEKVRFRFKLEGQDSDWREVVNDRQVQYSNLAPKHYRFRVTACNNSGVWNEAGTFVDFSIAPAYYQATWFRALCVVAFLALLWVLYQRRLHELQRQLSIGFEARVDERLRIARELHDTLLQSFQGLLLRFQAVSNEVPEGKAKQKLDNAIDLAHQAITEGRDAVQGLRSTTVVTNDLAESLRCLGQGLAGNESNPSSPRFDVAVEGGVRDLHPILRDEVYRIGGEALRNAFCHAQANHIEVEIHYGASQLRLRIRDDGKGIAPDVVEDKEPPGHWGLHGMRERAKIIGGNLEVWSSVQSGTEVELTIPARSAYASSPRRRSWFSKKAARGSSGTHASRSHD